MLPSNVQKKILYRPSSRKSIEGMERIKELKSIGYDDDYIKDAIISNEDAHNILIKLGIKNNTSIYQYYLNWCDEPISFRSEDLYGLCEILEAHKNQFWEEYPQIGKRYLQMSSIEGEWSYFYDKETDAMYGVGWNEMDDFVAGKLKPLFTSFYDFLEWYYSEDEE